MNKRFSWITILPLLGITTLILSSKQMDKVVYAQVPEITDTVFTNTPTPTGTAAADIIIGFPLPSPSEITPTITGTGTATISPTATLTSTLTPTPSETPTLEPTFTPTATPNPFSYLPIIIKQPTPTPYIPPETALFCDSLSSPVNIPDNDPYGTFNDIWVTDPRIIVDLNVALRINHSWIGDLVVRLTHLDSGRSIDLIDRIGIPATEQGCWKDNIAAILDDEITSPVEWKCAASPAAVSGIYIPNNPLSTFDNESVLGTWRLELSDNYPNDTGYLSSWCLAAEISPYGGVPTPTPIPPPLPNEVRLTGVSGRHQALPLDCESRSAVDWASYFGYYINELTFFGQLPHSDNPDKGFVGNVNGQWGQIPPNSYGVHAEPVAALLRAYGVPAYAHRPLSWDALRAEVAAGRPVFVWIIGSIQNGIPVYYTPFDGLHTVVARYEHTVVVTGYDENFVYYLNGDTIYTRPVEQFLDSWSALGNMAITTNP